MRFIKAYLNADIPGHDLEVEFEVEDCATDSEIEKIAWEKLCSYIYWYWEEVNEDDV